VKNIHAGLILAFTPVFCDLYRGLGAEHIGATGRPA